METTEFVRVSEDPQGKAALAEFLTGLTTGKKAFRYFEKRPLDVVDSHEVTLLMKVGGDVVAYGHLEQEGGILWLGIAVTDRSTGKGWGTVMMERLLDEAVASPYDKVFLRVDRDNEPGIRLYRKFGFSVVEEHEPGASLLMVKALPHSDASGDAC